MNIHCRNLRAWLEVLLGNDYARHWQLQSSRIIQVATTTTTVGVENLLVG
ncbi:MAG: hypothetical protein ACYTXC_09095 [Nostoc sp.]